MSEEENKSPIAAEEPMEQNGEDLEAPQATVDKGASGDPAASSDSVSPRKEESVEEQQDNTSSPKKESPKKDAKSPKKSPKKSPEKVQEEDEGAEEESDDEGDEGDGYGEGKSTALLEQPIVLEEGSKRVRKKVERMEIKQTVTPKDRKLEIAEGSGTRLGDIPRVEFHLGKILSDDLKPLHRVLFSRPGSTNEIKRNIRKFSGYAFEKDSSDYEKKILNLNRCTMTMLKNMCEVVDVERSGTKEKIVERLMDFLMCPKSSGKALPKPKKRKSAGGKGEKKRRSKKEDGEKKSRSPKKKPAKSKEEVESDDDEDEKDQSESEDKGEDGESTEEEKPPKKKVKKETPKKETPKKSPKKETAKKAKKETKKIAPKKAAEKKKTPKKQKPKKPASDSSDSSESDDEPLVPRKRPPTNEEVRETVRQILDGANLEEVTMKTVCRQVYDKYPDFDLTPRKDFIKATVKQIIR